MMVIDKLKRWEHKEPPAHRKISRLRKFAGVATSVLDGWGTVLGSCPGPCDHPGHLAQLLDLAAPILANDRSESPTLSWVRQSATTRIEACDLIENTFVHDDKSWDDDKPKEGDIAEPQLIVAVVHQTKAAEYEWVLAVALSKGNWTTKRKENGRKASENPAECSSDDSADAQPDDKDTEDEEERNVWWVLISRSIIGAAYLGVVGNDQFWPARRCTVE